MSQRRSGDLRIDLNFVSDLNQIRVLNGDIKVFDMPEG
jgi:hypothetical protein